MLATEFRVIVPDHPGWGLSDRPDWVESMDDLVYHYLDFLETIGLDARTSSASPSEAGSPPSSRSPTPRSSSGWC